MAESTTFVFRCGVARFDASGHLFVHLTHSPEAPVQAMVDGEASRAPADERRGQISGGGEMKSSGQLPGVPDLPRGYLADLRGFDTAVYEDGALTVRFSSIEGCPDWITAGSEHLFEHPAERIRLWAKSALPEGVTLGEAASDSQSSVRTQGDRTPTLSDTTDEDAPDADTPPDLAPNATIESEPYQPDRRPAGAYESATKKTGGLGCSTLMLAAALVLALAAIA